MTGSVRADAGKQPRWLLPGRPPCDVRAALGADFDNVFNHPLKSPSDGYFAWLGSFSIDLDPRTGRLLPIRRLTPNPDFARLFDSIDQESIANRRLN